MKCLMIVAAALFVSGAAVAGAPDTPTESALVARARAELADNQASKALADADAALAINSADTEAADLKARAQASIAGQGQKGTADASAAALNGEVKKFNDDIASRNVARETSYNAGWAEYKAQQADYANEKAAYQDRVRSLDAQYQAEIAAWRTAADACRRRQMSKCRIGPPIAPPIAPK